MKIRFSSMLSGLLLLIASTMTQAQDIATSASELIRYEKEFDQARLAAFTADSAAQLEALKAAQTALKQQETRAQQLREEFSANEQKLEEKTEALRLRTGSLGEMFGVVRQVAGDLRTVTSTSLARIDGTETPADLDALAESRALPALPEIRALWQSLRQEASLSSQIASVTAPVIQADGATRQQRVVRLGSFTLINDNGFLISDDELGALRAPVRQPDSAAGAIAFAGSSSGISEVTLDPSRGALLSAQASAPGLAERIQQGGTVGYIIITIGLAGLILAIWRLFVIAGISRAMAAQLSNVDQPQSNNALGRILAAGASAAHDSKLLEARMDEAVLRELPAIERGQAIIKLLAGIAPLLGLLGTVTGMIATFQAITVYGSGDAKLMAAGISQALITTVLGLIVAVPLLLLHSWVSSRSRALVQILDEQSAGILAESRERSSTEGQAS
ncbi:MAG: MotA/TolQ/ExbB proton channel family protein [Thalassolituus sp.]